MAKVCVACSTFYAFKEFIFGISERNGLGKITIFIVTVEQTQIVIKFTTIYSKNSYMLRNFLLCI